MVSERDYNILLNKYNIAVARIQELTKQIRDKEEEYSSHNIENERIDKTTREFCEVILAKDRSEMVLNGQYTWAKIPTVELVHKAQKSYNTFNDNRNDLLNRLMGEVEKRGAIIETLKEQLCLGGSTYTDKELEQEVKERKAKENAANKGLSGSNIALIRETDEDVEDTEITELKKEVQNETFMKTTPNGFSIQSAPKKVQAVSEQRKNDLTYVLVNIKKNTEKWKDIHWTILRLLGEGASRYDEILNKAKREDPNYSDNNLRNAFKEIGPQVIETTKYATPFTPVFSIYRLTDIGKLLYKDKYDKNVSESEADMIIKEHTSIEHGYGILQLGGALKSHPERYKNISIFNRKKPLKIPNTNRAYVPDISYESEFNGKTYKNYIEYETGACNEEDLVDKLNKVWYFTKRVQIIVPSQSIAEGYIKKIEKYAQRKEEKNPGGLRGKRILIASAKWFVEHIVTNNEAHWAYEFDFNSGLQCKDYTII